MHSSRSSTTRRSSFALLLLVGCFLWFEAMGAIALWWFKGEPTGPGAVAAQRRSLLEAPDSGGDWFRHRLRFEDALHPYLGYVADPDQHPTAALPGFSSEAIELGFPRNRSSLLAPRASDEVVLLLVGGSVAHLLADAAAPELRAGLEGRGRFAGKRVRVVSAAMPGYKQPQQLMAVAWLIALGAPIDLVVNLDGFNELVLPATEHTRAGVFPLYPRGWKVRVDRLGGAAQRLVAQQAETRRARAASAARFDSPLLRYSFTASAVWLALDRRAASEIALLEEQLLELQGEARSSYQARGPRAEYATTAELYAALVGAWERSSLALSGLCAAQGIEYFHFLQPNQYADGAKPLTPEEERTAWRADQPYREPVQLGYPLLEQAGARLRSRGAHFTSLVRTFEGVDETLYVDDCCHFNAIGMKRVADAVTREILADD